ncbi:hypothetical protein BGZ65_004756, partial [Modicella reniformis]
MDMSQPRLKHRQGIEPNQFATRVYQGRGRILRDSVQAVKEDADYRKVFLVDYIKRRIRHIQCIQARNLTFTLNANQRTLASVLFHPSASSHHYDNNNNTNNNNNNNNTNVFSHSSIGSYYNNSFQYHGGNRSITPSLEPPSGASSPTRSYFRSPWKGYSYYQGIPKVKGPGSDAGSVSASESGRASSVIKEPIARLSAGLKATVFSSGNSLESGYTSESGYITGGASKSKSKARYRFSTDQSALKPSSFDAKRQQQQQQQQQQTEDLSSPGTLSKEWTLIGSTSPSGAPPPTLSAREKFLLSVNDAVLRGTKESRVPSPSALTWEKKALSDSDIENYSRLPAFVLTSREHSSPILLDTYFTLHEQINDQIIYTSETVMASNNPNYNPLEEHLFMDPTKRRSSNITIRIWASHRDSQVSLLLEWRVDLCCLRYIGKELRRLPTTLPNNTILFGFENGYYTAPDDDDMADHPHTQPEPISVVSSIGAGAVAVAGGGVNPSYTYDSVMRLNNLHECIADTKESRDEIKNNIETVLSKENAPMIMRKRQGECTERLWHLQRKVGHELNVLETNQKKAAALQRELDRRRQALAESQERGQTQAMYLEENMMKLSKNKESLYNVLQEYSGKRTELIATLFTIFPITEAGNVHRSGIRLVVMLAHYLSVPLRYPLTPMGSRAFVLDPVSRLIGPKEFPLFGRGQDSQRFEYGVFLLNKNVEQLLNSQGLQFMDLRQTLPNLRYLMETLLTTSPSQSMLIRSKLFSRRKQLSQEYERLANILVIPVEHQTLQQHGHNHVLDSETEAAGSSSGFDTNEHERPSGSGKRLHERNPSTSKSIAGERCSPLVREYDPIEGDYMLILDNNSRSRNEIGGSEISTAKRGS